MVNQMARLNSRSQHEAQHRSQLTAVVQSAASALPATLGIARRRRVGSSGPAMIWAVSAEGMVM